MRTVLKSIASIVVGILLFYILYTVAIMLLLLFVDRFPTVTEIVYKVAKIAFLHHTFPFALVAIPSIVPAITMRAIMGNESAKACKCTAAITIAAVAISVFVGMEFDFTNWLFTLLGIATPFWAFVVGE